MVEGPHQDRVARGARARHVEIRDLDEPEVVLNDGLGVSQQVRLAGTVVGLRPPRHRADVVPRVEEGGDEAAADEAGRAGDEDGGHGPHARSP